MHDTRKATASGAHACGGRSERGERVASGARLLLQPALRGGVELVWRGRLLSANQRHDPSAGGGDVSQV